MKRIHPKIITGLKGHANSLKLYFVISGELLIPTFLRIGVTESQVRLFCLVLFVCLFYTGAAPGPMADGREGSQEAGAPSPVKG